MVRSEVTAMRAMRIHNQTAVGSLEEMAVKIHNQVGHGGIT